MEMTEAHFLSSGPMNGPEIKKILLERQVERFIQQNDQIF